MVKFATDAKCMTDRLSERVDLKHLIFSPSYSTAKFQTLTSVFCRFRVLPRVSRTLRSGIKPPAKHANGREICSANSAGNLIEYFQFFSRLSACFADPSIRN